MDYFDFEEASNAIPQLDLNFDAPGANIVKSSDLPDVQTNESAPGAVVKLKLANDREVECILWEHDLSHEFPMFKAKVPCQVCTKMGMDCYLASRGALITGCTCCISLYKECSFTHAERPKGFYTAMAGISEEDQVCQGSMQLWKPIMRSYEETRGRKSGSRFPRDAVKILKQWLLEHSDHPYPNEREKDELKQLTGLKRRQIADWLANARRRGKVRAPSGPVSPMLGAIDIPSSATSIADLNPLDRWKASPPENEAALMTDIARAIGNDQVSRRLSSQSSQHNSRSSSRHASSEEDSNFSMFRAPSVSSFETRESTDSDFSFASSRSQQSKLSLASSQERRRRRRAPMTQRMASQATKPKGSRPFQCTFCTDTFGTKYDWQRHEKSLHLALERWICCPTGGTILDPASNQQKCAFCPEFNPTGEHLEQHNFSSCQEKSIQERTFYRKDHLRQHLKLMHNTKFVSAMESWKDTTTELKSRCGFCPSRFSSWQQRADHLAAHFRNGSDMSDWKGDWGFEPHVEKLVEDALPPYLIALERVSMNPFVAKTNTSPHVATPGLSNGTSVDGSDRPEADQLTRDSNCWYRVEEHLSAYVIEQTTAGIIPTDRMLQDHARTVVYGTADPWDWTAADNQTWLDAFKYQAGIGPAPGDAQLRETRTVPIMAPYVVKGGLKAKRLSGAPASVHVGTPLPGSLCHTPLNNNVFDLDSTHDFDLNMDLDLDGVDFNTLDLGGLDDNGFGQDFNLGAMSAAGTIDSQYAPAQSQAEMFGAFEMGTDMGMGIPQGYAPEKANGMDEHDLSQLTRYMAGFDQTGPGSA